VEVETAAMADVLSAIEMLNAIEKTQIHTKAKPSTTHARDALGSCFSFQGL
jgi:predicted RNase H-like nuclease (RuvC/YqgF family)